MTPDDDGSEPSETPEDRPEDIGQQDAVDPKKQRRRKNKRDMQEREDCEFLRDVLQRPAGRRFVWGILQAAGTFEERYGFGPYGAVNQEATWSYRGQKDLGLRLYHTWSAQDRAGMLGLMDEFLPNMPKVKSG